MSTIRERTAGDLPAAVAALREVYDADTYPTAWPPDPAGWLTPAGQLAAWVAERDGYAESHGRRAALDVIASSAPAIALYESLGWARRGTATATWRTQNGEHPSIHFYLAPG